MSSFNLLPIFAPIPFNHFIFLCSNIYTQLNPLFMFISFAYLLLFELHTWHQLDQHPEVGLASGHDRFLIAQKESPPAQRIIFKMSWLVAFFFFGWNLIFPLQSQYYFLCSVAVNWDTSKLVGLFMFFQNFVQHLLVDR